MPAFLFIRLIFFGNSEIMIYLKIYFNMKMTDMKLI